MSIGMKTDSRQALRQAIQQQQEEEEELYTNAELLLPEIFDTQEHGSVVYLHGGKGTGKTHEAVNLIYWLVNECDYSIITNIQFIDKNGNQTYPEHVYFADDFIEYWKAMADIRRKNPQRPVTVVIDEFHKTCMRLNTMSVSVRVMYKWLSEIRKYISSALLISQNMKAIPSTLLWWSNWFFAKDSGLTSEYNSKFNTRYHPRKLTFMLPVRNFNVYYYMPGWGYWDESVENYNQNDLNLGSMEDVAYSGVTAWTDTKQTDSPTYSTHGSAMWEIGELGDMKPKEWMQRIMKVLGRTVPKEMPDAIDDFFERMEDDNDSAGKFEPKEVGKWIRDRHDGGVVELSDTGKRQRNIKMSYANIGKIIGGEDGAIDKSSLYQYCNK